MTFLQRAEELRRPVEEPGKTHARSVRIPVDDVNRRLELHGATYRFQVYLPEEWRRDVHKQWPIILYLHGRGERGSEGMWQTQIGLPQAVRDHPERWPFVIVMPQCPLPGYWTDPDMLSMAMAALDQEAAEFHGDPDRTYLSGLSLGGYAAWEPYSVQWRAVMAQGSGPRVIPGTGQILIPPISAIRLTLEMLTEGMLHRVRHCQCGQWF